MGNEWEVYEYKNYKFTLIYAGDNKQEAWDAAEQAKKNGSKMIKIEWR